jgi:vacuolar-type H+-ATPase subunit H
MVLPTTGSEELSPLDQIRQTETNITRQIAAARVSAGRSAEEARLQAEQIKHQAQEDGRRKGQAVYQEILLRAEEEAQAILSQEKHRSAQMQQTAEKRMDSAVSLAVKIVIGFENNGEQ